MHSPSGQLPAVTTTTTAEAAEAAEAAVTSPAPFASTDRARSRPSRRPRPRSSRRPEPRACAITVGTSGTGGGFEKFCAGETDISDASRPIEEDEIAVCKKNDIDYTEVQVANDGIAVVSNVDLKVDCMTTAQLKELWNKGSKVMKLSEIDPSFPDTTLKLFGPGTDSGTFDFFTEQINGEEGVSRTDYQPSEDDNVLVQGVEGEAGGLGYFGFSYYEQNQDKLNLIGVGESADNCIKPDVGQHPERRVQAALASAAHVPER